MPIFWVVMAVIFASGGTVGTTLQLLILYLRTVHFSPEMAASALSLELALSFSGRVGFGILSDRFSVRRVGIVACGLLGLSPLLLLVVGLPGVIIAFAVIHGLGHGGIASFQPLIMAEAFGTKYIGRMIAIGLLVYTGGQGIMSAVTGYAVDTTGSYGIGFVINSTLTLLATAAFIMVGRYLHRSGRTISALPLALSQAPEP